MNKKEEEYTPRHAGNYDNVYIENNNSSNNYEKYYNINKNININKELDEINKGYEYKEIKKKKRDIKSWVWILIFIILIIIILVCIFKILLWYKDNTNTKDVVNEINEIVKVEEKIDDENTILVGEPTEDKVSDYWYYIKFPLIDVDINSLKEKNKDTVGWINVNNTNINYPYVKANDNVYYLDHSFDKTYNEAGWVFLDYRNDSSLKDKNNILYAHSRLDKTMFGSLSKVLKESWYNNKDNHIIRISTEEENTMWQIFSVYKIPEESYYITTEFSNDSTYEEFLNVIAGRSIYNFNTTLTIEDKILTLSTCYSDTERTVVHAKLIKRSTR